MPDLERELAQYGTVLRDRAPAVRINEVESRLRRPPLSNHRPVRAAVAGAVLALASIGVVFVAGALVDAIGGPSPTQEPTVAPASGTASGPAVLAVVTGGGAVAVLVGAAAIGLRHRYKAKEPQRLAKSRERRKRKMRTMEKPVAPIEKLERNNRYLIVGLVVAVLLAVGFGAWLLVDAIGSSTERQITNLLDDYGAAWEANDGDAALALMTEDARVLAGNGATYQIDAVKRLVDSFGEFPAEPVGDLTIYEFNRGWHVASQDRYGLELFFIVEQEGELLIKFHETWRGGV